MTKFEIPHELQEKLDENRAFSGLVDTTISEFGVWLERNNVKFFTEYTDHSLKHIQDVLRTADGLIREGCRGIITSADVATLVIACLLHDCAMHLSIDSFIYLVQIEKAPLIPSFDCKSWRLLWLDFLAEARRFSGRKLMALFGDSTTPVEYPPLDRPQDMTGRDLLLIGEFLRRHHARLAHEIALFGVPSPDDNTLKLISSEDNKHIIDLAGLVARSHGMAIRDCLDYLRNNYSSDKIIRGIHPVFIMALLRIADILQISSDRAPKQVLKVQKLQSPASLSEWETHQAIKDVTQDQYPETIFVVAEPKTVSTYLKVQKLLEQIQSELDTSWTVLGEVYAYDEKFSALGIKIRRVRSNIDDLDKFKKRVDYIPTHASFEVADTDLLKLLVGPLYGYKPEIGIRELIQNSIDAVNELQQYQKQRPEFKNIELTEQEGDVVVSIDQEKDETWWLTVSDRGIGMTVETVKEYFLKAGASLRNSDLWKKTFEDEKGKSQVLRSGRFGVGALAVFLVGSKMYLSTRYVGAPQNEGIEFSAEIDTNAIELRPINRSVGTTIRIRLSDEVKELLTSPKSRPIIFLDLDKEEQREGRNWDWYCLSEPKVIRKIQGKVLKQSLLLPSAKSNLLGDWHRIRCKEYDDVIWSCVTKAGIICNGIVVSEDYYQSFQEKQYVSVSVPAISIFDYNAKFPLNLQRTGLSVRKIPFEKELLEDIVKDFIAYLLVNAPGESIFFSTKPWYDAKRYDGLERVHSDMSNLSYWLSTESGFGIAGDPWFLRELNISSALIVFNEEPIRFLPKTNPNKTQIILGSFISKDSNDKYPLAELSGPQRIDKAILTGLGIQKIDLLEHLYGLNFGFEYFTATIAEEYIPCGGRVLIKKKLIKAIDEMKKHSGYLGYEPLTFINKELEVIKVKNLWEQNLSENIDNLSKDIKIIKKEWEDENWLILATGNCLTSDFDFMQFIKSIQNTDKDARPNLVAEWYFDDESPEFEISMLAKIWKELIGEPTIPLNLQERRKKLVKAYKELKPYIKAHEARKSKNETK